MSVPADVSFALLILCFKASLSQVSCGKTSPPGSLIKPTVALSDGFICSSMSNALALAVLNTDTP